MDYLEKEFGIKEGQIYFIIFDNEYKVEERITGNILNFNCNQLTVKTKYGLYIIDRNYVKLLRPTHKLNI